MGVDAEILSIVCKSCIFIFVLHIVAFFTQYGRKSAGGSKQVFQLHILKSASMATGHAQQVGAQIQFNSSLNYRGGESYYFNKPLLLACLWPVNPFACCTRASCLAIIIMQSLVHGGTSAFSHATGPSLCLSSLGVVINTCISLQCLA